jgi:hypothetical protein
MPPQTAPSPPRHRKWRIPLFVILLILTLLATALTPADIILQLVRKKQVADAIGIAAISLFFYGLHLFLCAWSERRLYIAIKNIPRAHVPVEEWPRRVRRFIHKNWARSANIAWETRPRFVKPGEEEDDENTIVPVGVAKAVWGPIEHAGWIQGSDGRLVEYSEVYLELPHLLEAKAVSLAPIDELGQPDPEMVSLLQRPAGMGLRDYIMHLLDNGVEMPADQNEELLKQYEHARFGMKALSKQEFDTLMTTASRVMASMDLVWEPFDDQEGSDYNDNEINENVTI